MVCEANVHAEAIGRSLYNQQGGESKIWDGTQRPAHDNESRALEMFLTIAL